MAYFDALASSAFQTRDNRRLFFPWGKFGRGYLIPEDETYERLHRGVKTYHGVSLPIVIVCTVVWGAVAAFLVLPFLVVGYWIWARGESTKLEPVDDAFSISESLAGQARTHSWLVLFLLEFFSLVFVVLGCLIIWLDPDEWPMASLIVGFFGLCAFVFARQLLVKKRDLLRNKQTTH